MGGGRFADPPYELQKSCASRFGVARQESRLRIGNENPIEPLQIAVARYKLPANRNVITGILDQTLSGGHSRGFLRTAGQY
jgi:hypothetical protein